MTKGKFKKFLFPILIGVVLLVAIVLTWLLSSAILGGKKCNPLTPLTLEKFKIAGNVRPIKGEKCSISKNSYLLKIIYGSSEEADNAKKGLGLVITGERNKIEGLDWITADGNSTVFWTDKEKLGILVVPKEDTEKAVKEELDKAIEELK